MKTSKSGRVSEIVADAGLIIGISRTVFRGFRRSADLAFSFLLARQLGACGSALKVQIGARIEQPCRVFLGDHCTVQRWAQFTSENSSGTLVVGDSVQINGHVRLDHTGDLWVGNRTLISEDVLIFTHSHGLDPRSDPCPLSKRIGEDVWVGARAVVLEKCRSIGDHAIVAAGAVVAKDVPGGYIAYGNPCRFRPRTDLSYLDRSRNGSNVVGVDSP